MLARVLWDRRQVDPDTGEFANDPTTAAAEFCCDTPRGRYPMVRHSTNHSTAEADWIIDGPVLWASDLIDSTMPAIGATGLAIDDAGGWGYEPDLVALPGANPDLAPLTLQHLGWRSDDPPAERFVQRDPIRLEGDLNPLECAFVGQKRSSIREAMASGTAIVPLMMGTSGTSGRNPILKSGFGRPAERCRVATDLSFVRNQHLNLLREVLSP